MNLQKKYKKNTVDIENIPEELKVRNQWVAWKTEERDNGKIAKIPVSPISGRNASVSNPATWASFEVALKYYSDNSSMAGIGFVFHEQDPYIGIDIDDCLDPDNLALTKEAEDLLNRFNSYTEISPSGMGLHIYLKSDAAFDGKRKGNVELYSRKRFFTVTGKILGGVPKEIKHSDEAEELFSDIEEVRTSTAKLDYSSIIKLLCKKYGQKFEELWGGFTGSYPSPNEADLALCRILAEATQSDFSQIDTLFKLSGLYRPKWDRGDYKKNTITKAILSSDRSQPRKAPYYNLTDLGNAERFAEHHRNAIRWCGEWKCWMVWDGKRWQRDDSLAAMQLAKKTVRSIYQEASNAQDDDRIKISRHAMKSESEASIRAMLAAARSELEMSIHAKELDDSPWLLNCNNGVLDLKTGNLLSHSPEFLFTKIVKVDYIPGAPCPHWLKFLDEIMGGDQEMVDFLQRAVGYGLTGSTREQCFFILYGKGSNGKTTFLGPLSTILNDYAMQSPTETFFAIRKKGANNDVARLKGARFVTATEAEADQRFAESLLKQVTGGDIVTARFLNQEFFDFTPIFKLFLATNHKPKVNSEDFAMWRRIRLVPFEVTIPEKERDENLPDKLGEELEGILAWMVQGCLQWQKNGLGVPLQVKSATMEYAKEMDTVGRFIDEQCELSAALKTSNKELFHCYLNWCQEEGEQPLSKTVFGKKLSDKNFEPDRNRSGRGWKGIGLISNNQPSPTSPSLLPGRGPVSPEVSPVM